MMKTKLFLTILISILLLLGCTQPVTSPTSMAEAPVEQSNEETQIAEGESIKIKLEPFTSDDFGICGVVPAGWTEAAPGVYTPAANTADGTFLIQKSYPDMTLAQINAILLPQMGLEELPESIESYYSATFVWDLYTIEVEVPGVGPFIVEIAQNETDAKAYMVLLQAFADEYRVNSYHETIFLPAVESLALTSDDSESAMEGVYEDPNGRFSVPIPTNWIAEQANGYGILTSPDETITIHLLAVEGDDVEAVAKDAWAIVDPEFNFEPVEVSEVPETGGVELYYDVGDENTIVVADGRLHEGVVYFLLAQLDRNALQTRTAQMNTIIYGFRINELEDTDLTGVQSLPLTDGLLAELETYIEDLMVLLDVPGATVAIVKGDEILYANGFGVRQRGHADPVTPETLMMIGSTTKTMTTMLMAQLVDERLMEWDTPVLEILPTFEVADPNITPQITIWHLVCACTGVPRRDAEAIWNYDDLSAEDIIESLAAFNFLTDLGETFQYSNQMVATGGYISALAAGGEYGNLYNDYVSLVQERILDPIDMPSSTFYIEQVQSSPNYAIPHSMNIMGETVPIPLKLEEHVTPSAPAGGLWSTVLDMGRYLMTELNGGVAPDGTRIVAADSLEETWKPQVAISSDLDYGLGWFVDHYKGLLVLHHPGNSFGFTSDLAFIPEADLGIVVLTNQFGSKFNEAIRLHLIDLLYQQEPVTGEQLQVSIRQTEEALANLRGQLSENIDPDAVAPYLGTFTNDGLGEITVELQSGLLTLDAGEFQMELMPQMGDEGEVIAYRSVTPGFLAMAFEFSEDDYGNPIIVRGSGENEYIFVKE
jgi:CubicO group peptidase (beta-lactamase class C family)